MKSYDVLILGGGPAGLTAAMYAGRYNLKTKIIFKTLGGVTIQAGRVENWPGFIGSGKNLIEKFKKQAEKFGAEFLQEEISYIRKEKGEFIVKTENNEIRGKSLIIALGTENKKLNIEGEKEFLGKGVSYCATCDGFLFKNRVAAVIGGANSSAKTALYLSNFAKKVYIIYRRNELKCEPISFDKIKNRKNIQIIYDSVVKKIIGNLNVNQIEIVKEIGRKNKVQILDVDGIFIEIGLIPLTEILSNLEIKMDKSYVITDKSAKTNVEGVFAAGDVTNNNLKQIVTAAGEGATAAKSAYEYLRFK